MCKTWMLASLRTKARAKSRSKAAIFFIIIFFFTDFRATTNDQYVKNLL